MFEDPNVTEFKDYFTRDFPYGTTEEEVMVADINRALDDASIEINPRLFSTQKQYADAFCLLAAHFLVLNLRASSQGLAGKFSWLAGSKGVGSVSESFSIPSNIAENPTFAVLASTNYGVRYLMRVLPLLAGQIFSVGGRTLP